MTLLLVPLSGLLVGQELGLVLGSGVVITPHLCTDRPPELAITDCILPPLHCSHIGFCAFPCSPPEEVGSANDIM